MIRYGLTIIIMALAAGCEQGIAVSETPATNPQVQVNVQPNSVPAVVDQLYAEINALAKDYPELAQFPTRAKPLHENDRAEVRFQYNVKSFSEMRETRPSDMGANGIEILFMVLDEPNAAWTTSPTLHLKNLKKRAYSSLVISTNPSPGLEEKLKKIIAKHKTLLQELDKKAAK